MISVLVVAFATVEFKTDLFTLIVEIHSLQLRGAVIEPEQVRLKLEDFYDQVDSMFSMSKSSDEGEASSPHPDVFRYLKAATKATNDKYARVARAEVIANLLMSTFEAKGKKKKKR